MRNVTQSDSNDLDQREMITNGNIRANQVVESAANVERHARLRNSTVKVETFWEANVHRTNLSAQTFG